MALLDSEVRRIRYELGYNVLSVGAEPYIGITVLFDQIIKPYLTAGASTTSTTAVSAAATPTPATLVLASAVGVTAGDVVIVDVDSRQERATVQSLAGSSAVMLLSKAHAGSYPVTVEGGESIIRSILLKLQSISGIGSADGGAIDEALAGAGVKKVDEIEFFGGAGGSETQLAQVMRMREYWRDELAAALGIERLNGSGGGGGSNVSVY